MIPHSRLLLIICLLLAGAFLRLWQFESLPPGLQHDEIFKAQEGRAIVQAGDWRLFYYSNQGHEGAYVWLNGLAYTLLGANRLMVKMPALWCGLLTLALLYRVGREYFRARVGLIALAIGAGCFWLVFTNRLGLRANLLPPLTLALLWGLGRIASVAPGRTLWAWTVFSGLCLGLALYTYTAAAMLYPAYGLFLAWGFWRGGSAWRARWRQWALASLIGALLCLPMLNIRLNDPQGQNRVSTINQPYIALQKGDPGPVLNNAALLLTMPVYRGDPEWRYNIPGRPLFWPPLGLGVYIGAVLLMRGGQRPQDWLLIFLSLWGLIPSLLTSSAPSFLRSLLILPSLLLFMALALDRGLAWAEKASPRLPSVALGLLLLFLAGRDMRDYHQEWAAAPEVLAIYRDDLESLAQTLRAEKSDLVAVSTADPTQLDPLIYEFSGGPAGTRVMWFDGATTMLLSPQMRPLLVSPLAPISPAHQTWLSAAYGTDTLPPLLTERGALAFERYQVGVRGDTLAARLEVAMQQAVYLAPPSPFPSDQLRDWGIPDQFPVNFGDLLLFWGYEMPRQQVPDRDNGVDNGLNLQLYLQPLQAEVPQNLSLFVHFIDWGGNVAAGRDFLGAPAPYWQTEFVILQDHYVGNFQLEARPYFVSLGLYNTDTGERYPVLGPGGEVLGDRVILAQLEVVSATQIGGD